MERTNLKAFDFINKGIIIVNKRLKIVFMNKWIKDKFEIDSSYRENLSFEEILPENLIFLKREVKKVLEKNYIIYLSYALHKDKLFLLQDKNENKLFFNIYLIPYRENSVFIYIDNITPFVISLNNSKELNKKIVKNIKKLEDQNLRSEVIRKLTDIFNGEHVFIKEAATEILKIIREYFNAKVTFFLFDKKKNIMNLISNFDVHKRIIKEFSTINILKGKTLSSLLVKKTKSPSFINDVRKYYKKFPTLKKIESKSLVVIPLYDFTGEPVGLIHIGFEKPQKFSKETRDFVRLISKNLSVGFSKLLLTDELEEYAYKLKELVDAKTEEVRRLAKLYSALIESQSELICRIDTEHKIIFANKSFLQFFKKSKREVLKINILELFEDKNQDLLLSTFDSIHNENSETELEMSIKTPRGVKTVLFIIKGIFNKEGGIEGYQIVGRDITRRRKAENIIKRQRELIKNSEKLAMLGRVSASIIHEINTPVTYIRTNSELVKLQVEDLIRKIEDDKIEKSEILKELKEIYYENNDIYKGTDRIIGITKGMKSFVRGEVEKSRIKLMEIVKEVLSLTYQKWHGKVKITKDIPEDVEIYCIKGQIEQVIINLLLNAIDAVRRSGRREIFIRGWNDKEATFLEIEDKGVGIEKGTLNKIFNPLFSTKKINEGTGLGLSVVKEIIDSHRGEIYVFSEPGVGTKFTIKLPLMEGGNE